MSLPQTMHLLCQKLEGTDVNDMNDLHHQPQLQARPGERLGYWQHDKLLKMLDFVHIVVKQLGDRVRIHSYHYWKVVAGMELDEHDVSWLVDRDVALNPIGCS